MKDFAPIFIFGGFAVVVCVSWYIRTYNSFVKYRNMIEEAWSSIDVALKRRFNLMQNLVNAVQGYMDHEVNIFSGRGGDRSPSSSDVVHRGEEERVVSESLNGLLALAQAYPELKASGNFLALQENLNEVEEDIQAARNRFNQTVRRNNTMVESFPSGWIARQYNFERANYFTLELATQRELPNVKFSSQKP